MSQANRTYKLISGTATSVQQELDTLIGEKGSDGSKLIAPLLMSGDSNNLVILLEIPNTDE